MATENIINLSTLQFPVEILPKASQWAGIDRGCTLTKVIYTTELDDRDNLNFIQFYCALFDNQHFEEAIVWLKDHAYLPLTQGPLHVTGVGCVFYAQQITEILGVQMYFVDEFFCQIRGAYNLIKHFPLDDVIYPQPPLDDLGDLDLPDMFKMASNNLVKTITSSENWESKKDNLLPAILVFLGSGGGSAVIEEDGNGKVVSPCAGSGKYFLGMGKALLGTANYDEICDLATRGFRGHVDTQAKDILPEIALSYGKIPGETPIFPMGKIADQGKELSDYKVEDIAHSLVSSTCNTIGNFAISACASEKKSRIFFGGNMVKAEIVRKEIDMPIKFLGVSIIQTHYLKVGHTGAIGAMLTTKEDQEEFMKNGFEN